MMMQQPYSVPPRPGASNPYSLDPNFHYWYHKYSWWYSAVFSQGSNIDTKTSRIAYSLGGLLAKDQLDHKSKEVLQSIKIKVLDFGMDGEIAVFLEGLVGKVETIKPHEIPAHLIHQKLQPNQSIVVISGLSHPQTPEVMQALFIFVHEGGRLLIYNSAIHVVSGLFIGKIGPGIPSTLISGKLKILTDKELFSSFRSNEIINLEYFRFPLEIIDHENITVIAQIRGQSPESVLIRFNQGEGVVYVMTSKMLTNEFLSKDPKQKTIPDSEVTQYLTSKGASKETLAAWLCALHVGHVGSITLASTAMASLESIAKLLIQERLITETLPEIDMPPLGQQNPNAVPVITPGPGTMPSHIPIGGGFPPMMPGMPPMMPGMPPMVPMNMPPMFPGMGFPQGPSMMHH